MTEWTGVDRGTSDLDQRRGVSHYQENTRLRMHGELQRRRGFARSNLAKQPAAITMLASANPSGGHFVVLQVDDDLEGLGDPLALWGDVQLEAPTGTRGEIITAAGDDSTDTNFSFSDSRGGGSFQNPQYQSASTNINSGGVNASIYRVAMTFNMSVTFPGGYLASGWAQYRLAYYLATTTWSLQSGSASTTPSGGVVTIDADEMEVQDTGSGNVPGSSDFTITGTATFQTTGGGTYYLDAYGPSGVFGTNGCAISGTGSVNVTKLTGGVVTYRPVITAGDDFATSFDLWARHGAYPTAAGDGVFVQSVTRTPGSATATANIWTPPHTALWPTADWRFLAIPRRGAQTGPQGTLAA